MITSCRRARIPQDRITTDRMCRPAAYHTSFTQILMSAYTTGEMAGVTHGCIKVWEKGCGRAAREFSSLQDTSHVPSYVGTWSTSGEYFSLLHIGTYRGD
jgi:hypothetical protein